MKIFYETLAEWWPLISPVADYEVEAHHYTRLIETRAPDARTLLELGSGGGHNAFYLKQRFTLTLSDLSEQMLAVSAKLNPDCEHVRGDMRDLDLKRRFDVVFVHDAIDYMTTEADLEAAIRTAHRHLGPNGLALFVPDHVSERFEPGSECGGSDAADGRAVRFLEWTPSITPGATTGTTYYSFLVRGSDGSVKSFHERHVFGLFSESTWVRLLEGCGFEVEVSDDDIAGDHTPRLSFFARRRGA